MKKSILNLVLIQILICGLFLLSSVPFQSCEPVDKPDEKENECDTCIRVLKPNIYLYPTENTNLDVSISFPLGGKIIASIPDFKTGWKINADTNGIINSEYEYLFYESEQPDVWQINEGWIIKRTELEQFFTENMLKYGFYGREIKDFIDYWIPRLKDYEFYGIYPQESDIINTVIKLEFSKSPDAVLRLFYLIRGTDSDTNSKIIVPTDNFQFKRIGFYITEWGVILK
jgi:hypothetical protein